MDLAMLIMQAVFLGSLPIILLLAKFFISKYLEEKARNLATKEDVEEITQKIEEVKAEVDLQKNIRETKYRLKYDACLRALALVDAVLSHKIAPPAPDSIRKQHSSTQEARACHNALILTCESPELLVMFVRIMVGPQDPQETPKPPTDDLNSFRNIIRGELGFGAALSLDRNRAWIGKVNCELPSGSASPSP